MTIGIDQAKQTFNIMMHPADATKKENKIGASLTWYYKLAIIPLIISIIGALLVGSALGGLLSLLSPSLGLVFGGAIAGIAVVFVILYFVILVPIGFFIDAAILHFFGKFVFRQFKSDYSHTFNGLIYGASPSILFFWLFFIPIIGWLAAIIVGIWSLIVGIFALSNQQKTSKLSVIGVYIGTAVVIGIIEFVVVALVLHL